MNVQALQRRIAALTREPPIDQPHSPYLPEWFTGEERARISEASTLIEENAYQCAATHRFDLRRLTCTERDFVRGVARMMLHRRRAREAER